MKRLTLLLFILALTVGIVRYTPLSFALRVAGINDHSIGWRQARGTIWNGQVTGLSIGGIAAGHTELKMRPSDILSGNIGFDARWSAPFGRAATKIHPISNGIQLDDTTVDVFLANAPFVDVRLRDLGASIRGEKLSLAFGPYGCEQASGTILTDAITLAGLQYGRTWPELKGNLRCEDRTLITTLSGDGRAGEAFRLTARYDGTGQFSYVIDASGIDFEAQSALTAIGFTSSENGLSYGSDGYAKDTQ
jgi:hypothetical protein